MSIHIVATGFDPFLTNRSNPTQQSVEQMVDSVKIDEAHIASVAKLVLPTCCHGAWDEIEPVVESLKHEPFFVLLTGLAQTRDRICFERFGQNVRYYRGKDNQGHHPHDEYIEEGPDAIRTKVPLFDLMAHMKRKRVACDISNYAGSFVCNETYFRSLNRWNTHPNCLGVLFVHVPPFRQYFKTVNKPLPDQTSRAKTYAKIFTDVAKFGVSRGLESRTR